MIDILRRKRLPDGSFGPLETLDGGPTSSEIEKNELQLKIQSLKMQQKIQNDVILEMIEVIFNGIDHIEEENEKLEEEQEVEVDVVAEDKTTKEEDDI